jgi:hypothetical protein
MRRVRSQFLGPVFRLPGSAMHGRKANATVAAPLSGKGTGASIFGSGVGKAGAFAATVSLVVAVFALALVAAPAASATKYYDSNFGGTGETGGLFSAANAGIGGIAVNDPSITADGTSHGGWSYVVDRGSNRVQAFDQNRAFKFALGLDVVIPGGVGEQFGAGGGGTSERQTVDPKGTLEGFNYPLVSGGYKLTFQGLASAPSLPGEDTPPIPFNLPASGDTTAGIDSMQEALESLASIDPGDVTVTGSPQGPYTIDFSGQYGSADIRQLVATNINMVDLLGQPGVIDVATTVPGGPPPAAEKCTVAAQCQIGKPGGLAGEFNGAQGIAVDQASGHFFVSERTPNRRVQEFTADGVFVRAFGWDVTASGPGDDTVAPVNEFETCNATVDVCKPSGAAGNGLGQIGTSGDALFQGIAVAPPGAPNAGRVYLADPVNSRVLPFTVPAAAGGSVVPSASFGGLCCGANQSPGAVGTFNATWPRHVAADRDGVVYASGAGINGGLPVIERYDAGASSPSFLSRITGGPNGPVLGLGEIRGLTIDHESGHLLVGRTNALGVRELDVVGKPSEVGLSRLVDTHAVGFPAGSGVTPVGVAAGGGRLFVTTQSAVTGTGTGDRVLVFDDSGLEPVPLVSMQPTADIGAHGAVANASVTPSPGGAVGFATSYRFQLSKNGVTWTDASALTPIGDVATPVAAQASLTGLEANTIYRVRVYWERPGAGNGFSPESTFTTDAVPPEVAGAGAQRITSTSAQLVGRVNPNGLETTYQVQYGRTTDYGTTVPAIAASAGAATSFATVGQQVSGLRPDMTYHFRIVATNAQGVTTGPDRSFTTRSTSRPPDGRAYEMVTPADKNLRRFGDFDRSNADTPDYGRMVSGLASPAGGSYMTNLFAGLLSSGTGAGFAFNYDFAAHRRSETGWASEPAIKLAPVDGSHAATVNVFSTASDFGTMTMRNAGPSLWPSDVGVSTVRMGDDGGPRGRGMYPFLDPTWWTGPGDDDGLDALIMDQGRGMVGWSDATPNFRGVTGLDDAHSPSQLTPAQNAGKALFWADGPDWRPRDLINECTGSGSDSATTLPARVGSGAASDTIGQRDCAQGSPTSTRGATLGAGGTPPAQAGPLGGTATTAISEDGKRVFFMSPDLTTTATPSGGNGSPLPNGLQLCTAGTGAATQCPPQLFVRQYDDDGNATVRWISKAAPALFDAPQQIGLLGGGVSFEGASSDGQVVYFRSNAPLTTDDPNAGCGGNPLPCVTGAASPNSWDLYRYELPGDNNTDPADGLLTRVTGGPGGLADPNTNCNAIVTAGSEAGRCAGSLIAPPGGSVPAGAYNGANGAGGALRFHSEDGSRAYVVTASPILGADNSSPSGGTTAAAGTQVNTSTRNLYLFDAGKSGSAAYKFIANIPFKSDVGDSPGDTSSCASFGTQAGARVTRNGYTSGNLMALNSNNCFTGTSSGSAVLFGTTGQLTADDTDFAFDLYVYDAGRDQLVRISAPPPGAVAYQCVGAGGVCNATTGISHEQLPYNQELTGLRGERHVGVAEDDGGNLEGVFFESRIAFVPEDTNGDRMDVYEWRDGEVSLLSPGNSGNSAFFTGNSADGRDVFFWTEQRISPGEIDDADGDVYDARIGGGLPDPPAAPVLCAALAGACQGGGAGPVVAPVAKTVSPVSDGDATTEGRRVTLSVGAVGANARRRVARTGVLAVRVRSDRAGRVSAKARGRVGKRSLRVGSSSVRMRKPGVVTVRIKLSRAARAALRSGRPMRVRVAVRAAGARPRTSSFVLKGARR